MNNGSARVESAFTTFHALWLEIRSCVCQLSTSVKSRTAIVAFGLLAAFAPVHSHAVLMAYEGFNYPVGDSLTNASAQGGDGSFGWAGRWCGANVPMATNVAGSLSYTDAAGNSLVTSGNSVVIGAPAGTTINAQPSRSFDFGTLVGNIYTGLTNSPGTYWASFMMQWIGPPTAGSTTNQYVRKGDLVFRSGALTNATSTGTELYSVGSPNAANRIGTPYDTWATWTGKDAAAGTQNTGLAASTAPLNVPTFVLVRFDLNGGPANDTVYTWFNWTNLAVEPPVWAADTTNNTANEDGLNNIRLDANGANAAGTNTVLWFDEFRFGTTFADVAPYTPAGVDVPVITAHPTNATVTVGDTVSFSIAAAGAPPLSYQWYFNTNTTLVGATNAALMITNAQRSHAGGYFAVVSNSFGAATSAVATLTVLDPVQPVITTQPQNCTNAVGYLASFSVSATGTLPLSYQWFFNNNPLPGQTNTTLSFTISSPADAGPYFVVVTNRFGAVTSAVAMLVVVQITTNPMPAFPGADGAARYASGGRGGVVYRVTKLNSALDDPERMTPGTLWYGLSSAVPSPKTIVFDVAGVFHLGRLDTTNWSSGGNAWDASSRVSISGNNITIAGQTAPGPVIIMGGTLKPSGSNIIIRNITIAAGYGMRAFWEPGQDPPVPGNLPTSYTMDAMDISGKMIMIDHVDALYGSDETISCNEKADKLTVQYCVCALAQNYNQHSYGHLLGADTDQKVSFIRNLDAHIRGRLPRVGSGVGTGALNDFRNNVFYNWLGTAGYAGGGQYSKNNFINNFYLAGPGGDSDWDSTEAGGTGIFSGSAGYTFAYVAGNLKDINKDGDPFDTVSADNDYSSVTRQSAAYDIDVGVTLSARSALTNVLRYAGSRWWDRNLDQVIGPTNALNVLIARLVGDVLRGTGRVQAWSDDPYNMSGTYYADPANEGAEWRALWALRPGPNGLPPFQRPADWDTDQDGMPNYWELEHGLNPNVPNNNADFDNDGYTDLEEYLNDVAAWPAPGPILFIGATNNRYALIQNWMAYGEPLNLAGRGVVNTSSPWQPSRYDTAIISNAAVVVDAVGQHAGRLVLISNAVLEVTNGWLNVADRAEVGKDCTLVVAGRGRLNVATNLVNNGLMRLSGAAVLNILGAFTNSGVLDVMTWHGVLPPGFVNHGVVLDRGAIRIESARVAGNDFIVKIQGYSGHTYQLQYCDDLASGVWTTIGLPVTGANSMISLSHTNGTAAEKRFYRIAVQ